MSKHDYKNPKLLIRGLYTQQHRPSGIPNGPNFMAPEVDYFFVYKQVEPQLEIHGEVAHGMFLGARLQAITLKHPDGTDAGSPGVVGDSVESATDWLCGAAFQVALNEIRLCEMSGIEAAQR
jgi:hypothetical protein